MKWSIFGLVLFMLGMIAIISFGSDGTSYTDNDSEVVESICTDNAISVDFAVAEVSYETYAFECKSVLTESGKAVCHDRFYVASHNPDLYLDNAFTINKILFG